MATLYGWGMKAHGQPPWILQRGDFTVRYEAVHERFFFYNDESKSAPVSLLKVKLSQILI